MASTNKTPNYALPQFIAQDKPTWLGDVNGAMAAIDTGMAANKTTADAASTSAAQAVAQVAGAVEDATDAKASASAALTSATNALAQAQQATNAATSATNTANQANTTANTAAGNAAQALATANAASTLANQTAADLTEFEHSFTSSLVATPVDGATAFGVEASPAIFSFGIRLPNTLSSGTTIFTLPGNPFNINNPITYFEYEFNNTVYTVNIKIVNGNTEFYITFTGDYTKHLISNIGRCDAALYSRFQKSTTRSINNTFTCVCATSP